MFDLEGFPDFTGCERLRGTNCSFSLEMQVLDVYYAHDSQPTQKVTTFFYKHAKLTVNSTTKRDHIQFLIIKKRKTHMYIHPAPQQRNRTPPGIATRPHHRTFALHDDPHPTSLTPAPSTSNPDPSKSLQAQPAAKHPSAAYSSL